MTILVLSLTVGASCFTLGPSTLKQQSVHSDAPEEATELTCKSHLIFLEWQKKQTASARFRFG